MIDENVHRKLYTFLKKNNFDAKLVPKSASDKRIAHISKVEQRILVTNDEDFLNNSEDEIFSVIWLRVKQGDVNTLLTMFEKLLHSVNPFSGRLIILYANSWEDSPLVQQA